MIKFRTTTVAEIQEMSGDVRRCQEMSGVSWNRPPDAGDLTTAVSLGWSSKNAEQTVVKLCEFLIHWERDWESRARKKKRKMTKISLDSGHLWALPLSVPAAAAVLAGLYCRKAMTILRIFVTT